MSEDKVVQLDVQSPPTGTNGTDPAKDQREKSCGFGSCTFVAEWYRKMNEQETPVGPAGATIVSELRAEACPKCHGLFSNTSSLLPRIVLGRMDKLGHTIRQVYLSGKITRFIAPDRASTSTSPIAANEKESSAPTMRRYPRNSAGCVF